MRSKFKAYRSVELGGQTLHQPSATWPSSSSFFSHVIIGFKQGFSLACEYVAEVREARSFNPFW